MKLELYFYHQCPFCARIVDKISALGLNDAIEFKNTLENPELAQQHYTKTGRSTVPCLYIDDVPMFDVDAITINAYLGSDGVKPFIEDIKKYGKGCFILVKTSNISSGELQDKKLIDNLKVSEHVAKYVNEWGKDTIGDRGYSSIGAVVGATFSTQVKSHHDVDFAKRKKIILDINRDLIIYKKV